MSDVINDNIFSPPDSDLTQVGDQTPEVIFKPFRAVLNNSKKNSETQMATVLPPITSLETIQKQLSQFYTYAKMSGGNDGLDIDDDSIHKESINESSSAASIVDAASDQKMTETQNYHD